MIAKGVEETRRIAREFTLKILAQGRSEKATIVALSGELGAGKTTFTQEVGKNLGILENMSSPTFVIEKIYKLQNTPFEHLIHIDAYRIEQLQEMKAIGFDEIIANPANLIFIEWPERIQGAISKPYHKVTFSHMIMEDGDEGRSIEFSYEK